MIFNCILFLILISGSVFGTVYMSRKFEELLPITVMSIMLVLYIFGLIGVLKYGVVAVCLIVAGLYGFSLHYLIKKGDRSIMMNAVKKFFTPAFILFIVIFAFLSYADCGKLASSWDEFSHWMDCIKAMVYIDDFATNPDSLVIFRNLPPGMALFQYFVQKLFLATHKDALFNEWRMYLSYQIVVLSVLFPFFREFSFKKPLTVIASVVSLFFLPLIFYSGFYTTIYADPVLAILGGCGFAMIFVWSQKDFLYEIYMGLICISLVLTKDLGLFFAIMIAVGYLCRYLIEYKKCVIIKIMDSGRRGGVIQILRGFIPLVSTILIKVSWNIEKKSENINTSSEKINISEYTSMFFLGKGETYRQTVTDNYKMGLFNYKVTFGVTQIQMSYAMLLILLLVLLFIIYYGLKTHGIITNVASARMSSVVFIVTVLLYLYGMGAIYCYQFSEYEATALASYQRYMNTIYLCIVEVIILSTVMIITTVREDRQIYIAAALLIGTIFIVPEGNVKELVDRSHVQASIEQRSKYDGICNEIRKYCDEDDKVYFIAQEDNGIHFLVCKFILRPIYLQKYGFGGYSIGVPFYDGDIWTQEATVNEWKQWLIEGGYNYVAIYQLNDYFREKFAPLFEATEDISVNAVYLFDQNDGMLKRCR